MLVVTNLLLLISGGLTVGLLEVIGGFAAFLLFIIVQEINAIELLDNVLHFSYCSLLLFKYSFYFQNDPVRVLIVFPDRHDHFLYFLIYFREFLEQLKMLLNQSVSITRLFQYDVFDSLFFIILFYFFIARAYIWGYEM